MRAVAAAQAATTAARDPLLRALALAVALASAVAAAPGLLASSPPEGLGVLELEVTPGPRPGCAEIPLYRVDAGGMEVWLAAPGPGGLEALGAAGLAPGEALAGRRLPLDVGPLEVAGRGWTAVVEVSGSLDKPGLPSLALVAAIDPPGAPDAVVYACAGGRWTLGEAASSLAAAASGLAVLAAALQAPAVYLAARAAAAGALARSCTLVEQGASPAEALSGVAAAAAGLSVLSALAGLGVASALAHAAARAAWAAGGPAVAPGPPGPESLAASLAVAASALAAVVAGVWSWRRGGWC